MKRFSLVSTVLAACAISLVVHADVDELLQRGEEIYTTPSSCITCHGAEGEGGIGPTLAHGPTPYDVDEQFRSNPQMGPLREILKPTQEDLVAVALYIRTLYGLEVDEEQEAKLRSTLASIPTQERAEDFLLTERDRKIMEIETFESVLADWQRRAKEGSIKSTYELKVAREWDPEPAVFTPEPGKTYFYQNTGAQSPVVMNPRNKGISNTSKVMVGDAESMTVIDHYVLPPSLKSSVHTTAVAADGKAVYIIGSKPYSSGEVQRLSLISPATLLNSIREVLDPIKC